MPIFEATFVWRGASRRGLHRRPSQILLEKVSGQTFADFLQQNIFSPLGMTSTGIDSNKAILPQLLRSMPFPRADEVVQMGLSCQHGRRIHLDPYPDL